MKQITVKELAHELVQLVLAGHGDKRLVLADDNEGNGFHGMFYGITAEPEWVAKAIDGSCGLTDSQETDYNNIVILG